MARTRAFILVAFYNDINKYCCAWLKNLIQFGDLPFGEVYHNKITAVNYVDLNVFTQCHFFAGIGGWPLALKLANWPDDVPVWTGSCPCQPFSLSSTNRIETADERHLWPDFFQLIEKYKPATIFGEQVAGASGLQWLSQVRIDLESIGYAVGAANLPASSVGAEHQRQRLYWVAYTNCSRLERFKYTRKKLCGIATTSPTQLCNDSIRKGFYDTTNCTTISDFNGISRPVDIVRAFGNAIVPQLAAEFISSFLEAILCLS